MRDVAGNNGDIAFFKGAAFSVKLHEATVGMTDPDFQTIMKVEPAAGDIRYFPMIASEQKDWKVWGKIVVSVFGYSIYSFGHLIFSFSIT